MDAAIVELINRVERDLSARIGALEMRVDEMAYTATMAGVRDELAAVRSTLDAMVSDAASARDAAESAAATAIAAADDAEGAADDASDAADDAGDDDDEGGDDDDSGEPTGAPELTPPEPDAKTPSRQAWYERKMFGGGGF